MSTQRKFGDRIVDVDGEGNPIMRVASASKPNSLAGAIAYFINHAPKVILSCVGAGSVNQAIKSVAIARNFVAANGKDLICIPGFHPSDEIKGESDSTHTSIRITVEVR